MQNQKLNKQKCPHDKIELLGEQKGEKGTNKYFRCQKCGNVLVISEDGVLYEVLAAADSQ